MSDTVWVTGRCWLGCGRTRVDVIAIGPVTVDGAFVPLWACYECLCKLARAAWGESHGATPDTAKPDTEPP